VHLGTNGYITESQYRALLSELADREHVLLVNVHVPKPWMKPNNEIIARMPAAFPNVRVIDWDGLSATRPAFFGKDNTHLTMRGVRALSAQIKEASGGTVIMPAAEQDTMLAKSKGSALAAAPATAPAASKPALPDAEARSPAAPPHKEAPATPAPPAAEPSAIHAAGDKAARQPPAHVPNHAPNHAAESAAGSAAEPAANHLAPPSPAPAETQPVD